MSKKLSPGHLHILQLVRRDANSEGWVRVSKAVSPAFTKADIRGGTVPKELCDFELASDGSGRARLTPIGINVLDAMEYLR